MHHKNALTISHTTNFILFQTERACMRQFQICLKWQKDLQMGRKHCRKRRNCSLRAISPFPSVFKILLLQTCKNQGLFGKGFTLYHTIPTLNDLETRSLLNTLWKKEKMLVISIFTFFLQSFLLLQ